MFDHIHRAIAAIALAAAVAGTGAARADGRLFVASSLTEVAEALVADWVRLGGEPLTVVTGASSALARQIEAGAPADLFISANRAWVDHVIDTVGFGAAQRLFGNRLVIIAVAGYQDRVRIEDLPRSLSDRPLALADPDTVPAGIYAREALEGAGVWEALSGMLAPADNVRAAVALVANRAASFGIAYATDAQFPGVVAVGDIDPALHSPIEYWAAPAPGADINATAFLDWLGTIAANEVIAGFGFEPAWEVPSP